MTDIAIEARHLNKSFSGVTAADDVCVSVPSGAVISLIGANGAGKTTFVNMVTGYIKPDSGEILYHGADITDRSPREITRLGVSRSFQIPQTFNGLTLTENLLIAVSIGTMGSGSSLSPFRSAANGEAVSLVEDILERFRLTQYRGHYVSELPGGIRKLLDVAMAMTNRPRVLLLDEPTSGVAAREKYAFMDLVMSAVREERVAVLFVEHDMDIVQRYAERVVVFHEGRVLADDAPDEAFAHEEVRMYVTGTHI